MARVAFLGLGVMGYPIAGHLADRGRHSVVVFNRSAQRSEKWVAEHGGAAAATPAVAAREAEFVFTCVGNDEDLRSVVLGADGALAGMKAGSFLVDHTTASAAVAREIAVAAKARDIGFLDAPLSGGQSGAEAGQLSIMVGGDEETFLRVKPIMDSYAKAVGLMGPIGAGQLTKMVNQICLAGIVEGVAEGIHFAARVGLDVDKVIAVISKGAAQSWVLENRSATMKAGRFDFGFAVDLMRKDLAMTLAEARRSGATLPTTALIDQFYADVQAKGGGRWDISSLIARLEVGMLGDV